ncbi:MAG: hypothetical protein Q7S74_03270 [Nanoarchaeota archaeon]|nr:hypothetical protein [Nanoarchaeota archaeon]
MLIATAAFGADAYVLKMEDLGGVSRYPIAIVVGVCATSLLVDGYKSIRFWNGFYRKVHRE